MLHPRLAFPSLAFSLLIFVAGCPKAPPPQETHKPRLVVVISVDQLGQDLIDRYGHLFGEDGIKRLMTEGAWFSQCHYGHANTATGPGHAIIGSGCNPNKTGIVANGWLAAGDEEWTNCVGDSESREVDNTGPTRRGSASPFNLQVATLGDHLRSLTDGKAKIWSLSLKDRSAVLMGGHLAEGACWFRYDDGNFVSSTFYCDSLPGWCAGYNDSSLVDNYFKTTWDRLLPSGAYNICDVDSASYEMGDLEGLSNTLPKVIGGQSEHPDEDYYDALASSPFGNDILIDLAERAISSEKLGRDAFPDILWLGLSSNDHCGHLFGPQSHEILDLTARTDRQIGRLLNFLDEKIGLESCLIALTGDHGVCMAPESGLNRDKIGGRLDLGQIRIDLHRALRQRLGISLETDEWLVPGVGIPWIYFNEPLIARKGVNPDSVMAVAVEELEKVEGIDRVYDVRTADAIARMDNADLRRRIENNFWPRVSGQAYLHVDYGWTSGSICVNHGTAHDYDTHVPLIFFGEPFQQGRFDERVTPCDLAATLSSALGLAAMENIDGQVLTQCLKSHH